MKLFTEVGIGRIEPALTYSDRIMLIGSCFSDEIGDLLALYGFDVLVNPFGTLYNPCSVFNSLMRLGAVCGLVRTQDSPMFQRGDVLTRPDGLLVTYSHHSRCGYRPEPGEEDPAGAFIKKANEELKRSAEFFYEAKTIIITLGTSYVFRLAGTDFVVSNCHKLPASGFRREFLQAEDTFGILEAISGAFPDKRIIFTVSPIRHLSDGAHGNQLSKGALLAAVARVMEGCRDGSRVYFPAYEILMDELRDYRWYAEDLVHPSASAVKYIFEKFRDSCIAPECYQRMERELRAAKAAHHRQRG